MSSLPRTSSNQEMLTDGQSHSYGFTSFVGALNGVKGIMNNFSANSPTVPPKSAAPLSPHAQKQKKSLSNILEKFKIQTPETHLGLLLAYSDSFVGPVSNPDLEFQWFRHQNLSAPISISASVGVGVSSSSSPHQGWYAPSADDIGSIIRLRCVDSYQLDLVREYDSEVIRPDPELIHRVEEAIYKDRITSKVILSSVPLDHHQPTSSSSNYCEMDDFEIAGSIEIGSKGILICEKGIESSGLRFFSSSAIEVRCYQPSSLILRIPIPLDRSNSLFTWIGKGEGSLFVQLEEYLGSENAIPDHVETAQDSTQFLEIMVSCRDRLVRDSLALSIRYLPAFLPSDTTSTEAITRARLDMLPWRDHNEEHEDPEEAVSLELFELKQTSEAKVKMNPTAQKGQDIAIASPRSTVYTRSLSCNDLSILSSTKGLPSSVSSSATFSVPLRQREESGYTGYTCESFFLADDDIIAGLKHELSTLTERCKKLAEENHLLRNEAEKTLCQKPNPPLDGLAPDLQEIFSQAQQIFQNSSLSHYSKEVRHEQDQDRDAELSGTDSSEHSKEEESSQKNVLQSLEKLFLQLQTKCLEFPFASSALSSSQTSEEEDQLLQSRLETVAQELISAQLTFETQMKDLSEANNVKLTELSSLHQSKQTEYENQIHQLQLTIMTTQQQHTQTTQQLRHEHSQLESSHHHLTNESHLLQEKYLSLEQRNHNLQQEIYELSDSKQHLMKQLSQSDGLRKQLIQMKAQFQNLNLELMNQNELLVEKQTYSEKLLLQQNSLENEMNLLRRCNEKLCVQVEDLKKQNEELENGMIGIENQKKSLMKENHRLRSGMNELFVEKKRLDEIEPLYQQQLTVLATNHSRYTELEIATHRLEHNRNEDILLLVATEIRYGILNRRYTKLLEQFHQLSMVSEDSTEQRRRLEAELSDRNHKIKLLKQDLALSKQAEPFVVKKLNYLLSKLHGEKNHFENKAKSLSRDLQKKLLEGTPLQRELGRVTMRLEEVENERNAYRDAMVLVCDTYAIKDEEGPGSWFLY